ncbi:hypothetical protein WSK_2581 [Novosphingobium sp. Rr 2-17]|uniref:hypothetical protein n=1 Tax=Novosphingobium sp. Rr 2-17 TaxID=555793 RepID=UPI000269820C|nr:hypothetical protein [Novosphingobium sp. Rr 2-17]EIZ79036.1 hypothetical protein WSK_2581 [Novosphingobium sp. Rr 2-17]
MKKISVGLALGAMLVATAASAADQRPSYMAFKPSATSASFEASATPASPSVAKRNGIKPAILIPLLVGVGAIGLIAAFTTGSSGSPN